MHMHKLPMRLFRAAMILIAVSCVAAITPLLSQQPEPAADSVSVPEAGAAEVSAPSASNDILVGPRRAPPRFHQIDPMPPQNEAALNSSVAAQGGRHTIVISTLVLVLAVVIIVLLVAN